MRDMIDFVRARLDEEEQWALAASQPYGNAVGDPPAPDGGVHWQWEDESTDEMRDPDPVHEEYVDVDAGVSLRSREMWPTRSVGQVPQFAIKNAEEVLAGAGGHIVRHDPARVLRDIEAKRRIIDEYESACNAIYTGSETPARDILEPVIQMLAAIDDDHPDYDERWRP